MLGTLSISLQCACDVLARYTTPCPQCLENWDEDTEDPNMDIVMLAITVFTVSIGMTLYKNNIVMEDRVGVLLFLYRSFIDYLSRCCPWRVG